MAGRTREPGGRITLVVLSAQANFTVVPHYSLWALPVIALDIVVIWPLAAHGRDVATDRS
jgi:hypothetical protein